MGDRWYCWEHGARVRENRRWLVWKYAGEMAVLALLCVAAGMFSRGASAQTTLNLSDCSTSSLQTEWNLMSSGAYILVFPSCASGGTGNWTANLTLTVPSGVTSLTIQGNTTVSCTGTAGTSSYACTATDNTVIEDGVTGNNNPILTLSLSSSSQVVRVTGVTLEGGAGASKYNGTYTFWGAGQLRLDHDHFNAENYPSGSVVNFVQINSSLTGVADHDLWDLTPTNGGVYNGIRVFNDLGDSVGNADGPWAQPTNFGSSQAYFVENDVFNGGASDDCAVGGRIVERYDTFNDEFIGAQNHATKTDAGRQRGCRSMEVYHDYFSGPAGSPAFQAVSMKGGPGLIWGNNVASGYRTFEYSNDRQGVTSDEVATPNGWGYCGTTVAGSHGQSASNWDGQPSTASGWPCLDGVGRGQTQQSLNGQNWPNALNSSTGTIAWPQQFLEPVYVFDNTVSIGGFTEFLTGTSASVVQDRDVYVDNAAFNGSSGTGSGALSSRPATCTAGAGGTFGKSPTGSYGVAYFATDQGANGTLYVCTATNVWTAIYAPYTYPHPLIAGGGSSPLNPPAISPGSGSYLSPQTVTITATSGATICYRTDGNAPTASTAGTCDAGSTTYSGPFSLTIPTTGAVLQAMDTESGQTNSSVASASYTLQTCLNTPLGGNWTCVADASNFTSSSGTSLTAGPMQVNPPAGSLVVVFQWQQGNNVCTAPTDTTGTTFTGISSATVSAISMYMCDWYGVVGAGGAQESVTCNAGSAATAMACNAVDVTGQAGASIVDQACTRSNGVSATGLDNMNCANSINVSRPNELVLAAAFGDYGTRSAGVNFTLIDALNWTGEYFMEAAPMIWTPSETISASGLNYGLLAVTLEPYNSSQPPLPPTNLTVQVR